MKDFAIVALIVFGVLTLFGMLINAENEYQVLETCGKQGVTCDITRTYAE